VSDVSGSGPETPELPLPVTPSAEAEAAGSVRSVVGRAAMIILAATLVGRMLGLLRDIAVANFFGATPDADAFFLAYKIPYLLTLMVAGALTATFVPLFSFRLATGRRDEAWDLSVNIGNIIATVLIGVSVILAILAPWLIPLVGPGLKPATVVKGVFLFRILMIGFVFDGLAGLLVGMLNSLRKFALAAFAPAVGTIATIALLVAFARAFGITAYAIGSVAGSIVGLFLLFPGLRGRGIRYRPQIRWKDPAVREVAGMVWPILLGSAVGKISIFVDQLLGSLLGTGSISSLNYADKLFQLPLGLFVAGITVPIFPLLSEQVAAKAPERVRATLDFALRLMAFLLVPATVGIILLRYPLIGLLLQHGQFKPSDTARTAWALLFLCIGLYAYAGRDTVTRVFYAHHDTRTPVKISAATVVINIGFSYLLMHFLGVGGLTLGTTIALTVNFVVLMWLLKRKIGVIGFGKTLRSLLNVLGVSAVMGAVIWGVDHVLAPAAGGGLGGNAVRVVVGVIVGAVTFLSVARLVKMPELAETVDMLRAVLKRRQRKDKTA
jgi:putative peptidoglycan lipid II flippase